MKTFDQFLVSAMDKKFIDSATFVENKGVTTYKITSGKKQLNITVRGNEALLQRMSAKATPRLIRSNKLASLLPTLVARAFSPAKTFKTPFGIYSDVVLAPVARHHVVASAADITNGEIYKDTYLLANDEGKISVYLQFGDDWNLMRSFDSEDEAKFFCDKLSEEVADADESSEPVEILEEDANLPAEIDPILEEGFDEYALPSDVEAFEEDPSYDKIPLSDDIEFMTSSGKRFIVSHDETRITLGLYDLLQAENGEAALLLLPSLYDPSDPKVVQIQSAAHHTSDKEVKEIYSAYHLFPKVADAPKTTGVVSITQGTSLSKADRNMLKSASLIFLTSKVADAVNTEVGRQLSDSEFDDLADSAITSDLTSFCKINSGLGFSSEALSEFYSKIHSSLARQAIHSEGEEGIDFNALDEALASEDTAESTPEFEETFEETTETEIPSEETAETTEEIHDTLEAYAEGNITESDAVAAIGASLIDLGVEAAEASATADSLAREEDELGEDAFLESSVKRSIKSYTDAQKMERFRKAYNLLMLKYPNIANRIANRIATGSISSGEIDELSIDNFYKSRLISILKSSVESDQVTGMGLAEKAYKEGDFDRADATLRALGYSDDEILAFHDNWEGEITGDSSFEEEAKNDKAFIENPNPVDFTNEEFILDSSTKRIKSSWVIRDTQDNNKVVSSPYEDETTAKADADSLNQIEPGRYTVGVLGA